MKVWQGWRDFRRFQTLPALARTLVFYSETHQDWHHLQPLIDFLTERLSRTVCHVTSEPRVPLPAVSGAGPPTVRIRSGAVLTWFFQMLEADVMILTMLDLGNFQLKRSIHPVRYVYVFHSPGSTHMVDHENSYDNYDSLFCVGPHHVAEIRRREQMKALPPKHLFAHGYPRLERLVDVASAHRPEPSGATSAGLGLEPMEMRIRRELGTILPLDRLADAPRHVAELLRGADAFRERAATLREEWTFNFGRSVEVGAREIARIADERAAAGGPGVRR